MTWIGITKHAVSPTIVAGARLMIVKPPSSRSDIVIGASLGSGRSPAASAARTATAAVAPGGARRPRRRGRPSPPPRSTGPGPSEEPRGHPSRNTAGVEGYDAATYGDRFADVYDDWYGDVTDVGACTDRLAALADGGPLLELGVGSGRLALPLAALGVEVHGIDASEAMLGASAGQAGQRDASASPIGDMAELDLVDPPAFKVVLAAFNTLFNLGSRRCPAAVHRSASPRCSHRTACSWWRRSSRPNPAPRGRPAPSHRGA